MSSDEQNTLVMSYGSSGNGKTVDMGFSYPNALFIATRGSLLSIKNTCGYEPATIDLPNIQEATKMVIELKGNTDFDAIVVDDFSHLADKTMVEIEKKHRGFHIYSAMNEAVLNFRNAARYAGVHIAINCWEAAPKTNKNTGAFVRGGAMLSGKLPESMPALCDLVLRCGKDPMLPSQWKGIYKCQLDTQYTMKDRFGVCYNLDPVPQNIGEILRSAGINLSRLKGLEWQEEVVETSSNAFLEITDPKERTRQIETLFSGLISQGVDPKFARWTVRDVLDRMHIKKAIHNQSVKYFA